MTTTRKQGRTATDTTYRRIMALVMGENSPLFGVARYLAATHGMGLDEARARLLACHEALHGKPPVTLGRLTDEELLRVLCGDQ